MIKESAIIAMSADKRLIGVIHMRLIDADKLLAHLNDCALSASPGGGSLKDQMIAKVEYDAIQNCIKAVEEQPIAYDVDEIVRRLDDASFLVATSKEFWDDPQNGKYVENVVRLSDAIEIVKAGGSYGK